MQAFVLQCIGELMQQADAAAFMAAQVDDDAPCPRT
jgi:hypothetical protein